MKRKTLFLTLITAVLLVIGNVFMTGCTKEGPAGKDGADGADGTASCITCHSPEGIEMAATQYELSKHSYGEAAFEEAGSTTCGPCHLSEAFKYVCTNNTPSTFTLNTTTNKYVNDYFVAPTAAYGEINCGTCHSSLHTTYADGDLALTTVAPVAMTMWAGAISINLPADGGKSNLCVKCHQPRPFTASAGDGNVLDYISIKENPNAVFYDADASGNKLKPGYRTHTHYGTAGAVFAGKGGVEFGTGYENSAHTALASCQDCHMATMQGKAGGHTFFAKGNFNGCNVDGCHTGASATSDGLWINPRAEIKSKLDELAALLNVNGVDILNRNPDAEHNLWAANTTNKYDGYLNIYDPINNPDGPTNNPVVFQNPSPSNSWSQDQKDYNLSLPKITLTNAQMGSLINFQLCLRDYSQGIHNYKYTKTLLSNSITVLSDKRGI
ncbi:MAG: hypothetical protein V1775_15270 [Bacteroidota bacterium]